MIQRVPHVDFMELSKDLIRIRGNNFKHIQQLIQTYLMFRSPARHLGC